MKCGEKNCEGEIEKSDIGQTLTGPISCSRMATGCAFPCKKCGRLHWGNGDPIFSFDKEDKLKKAFFVNNEIIYR